MKILLPFFVVTLSFVAAIAQPKSPEIAVVDTPVSIQVLTSSGDEFRDRVQGLVEKEISMRSGLRIVEPSGTPAFVLFIMVETTDNTDSHFAMTFLVTKRSSCFEMVNGKRSDVISMGVVSFQSISLLRKEKLITKLEEAVNALWRASKGLS